MATELEKIIMNSCDLPTIPAVAGMVVQLVSDPNASVEMLSKAIRADEALAARVLKIANSAFYGCLRAVNTLSQAIRIIGFNTIKSIVLAASTKEVYKKFGLTEKILHDHSLGTAIAALYIAREVGFKKREEAFLAGLLHDIGKVILNNDLQKRFKLVMEEVYNTGRSFAEIEIEIFGFTHADVGGLVIKKWNFSSEMEQVVSFHHNIEVLEKADPYVVKLTSIINLADALCYKVGIGGWADEDMDLTAFRSFDILKLTEDRLAGLEEKLLESYAAEQAILD